MKIKAKRSSVGDYGNVSRNQVLIIEDETEAKKLIATGLYTKYDKAAEEREERERAEKAQAAKALEGKEQLEEFTVDEFERLRTENADLLEQHGTKDTAINGLREQLEKQADDLLAIPGLNDKLASANNVIKQHEETIAELVAKIADLNGEIEQSKNAVVEHEKTVGDLRAQITELTKPPAENETDPAKKPGAKKA
ncbi:hypothetical protein RMS29_028350 (plasmid) [Agrobacterium rosae]|uniref:Uncharacterized protein n=1 Tax=Agrobacterium rosae TaxID=1972867 RepID=A0ABU4W544_9HYPH|nr:hypothetical protein [Agrobacterium rosae]MDX8332899.1 hypothetical protein [Agrobacterium rosae]